MRYLDWEMQEAEAPLSGISHLQVIHTLENLWDHFGHSSLHIPAPGRAMGVFASELLRITQNVPLLETGCGAIRL